MTNGPALSVSGKTAPGLLLTSGKSRVLRTRFVNDQISLVSCATDECDRLVAATAATNAGTSTEVQN